MRIQNSTLISFGKLYVSSDAAYTGAQNQVKNYITNSFECKNIDGSTYTEEVKNLGYDIMLYPAYNNPDKIGVCITKYFQDSKSLYGSYNRMFDVYMGDYGISDFDAKEFTDAVKKYERKKDLFGNILKIIGIIGLGGLLFYGAKASANKEHIRRLEKAICINDPAIISHDGNSKTLSLFV